MVRHIDHHDGLDAVVRANRILLLSLMWAALLACIVGSLVYDVGHWVGRW
jgi:ABC-type uncharacterized transport system permease subunit